MTPDLINDGADVLIEYIDMLASVRGADPAAAKVMAMAFREWIEGMHDSDSGVPISDLETRLSKVIENLTRAARP
jgi:hypothetical protein